MTRKFLPLLFPVALYALAACESPADPGEESADDQLTETLLPEEAALLEREEDLGGRTFGASLVERIEDVTLGLSERIRGECDDDDNEEVFTDAIRTLTGALLRLNPQGTEPEKLVLLTPIAITHENVQEAERIGEVE